MRSASIGGSVILAPSGTLSEIFQVGDTPNNDYKHERLGLFLTSEMRIRCKCTSDRQRHYLYGSCDENTSVFGCSAFRPGQRIFGREMSRVVNRMSSRGLVCTCVLNCVNFIRDGNHFGNFAEYNILKRIHRKMLEGERRCAVHIDEKSSFA